MDNIPTESTLSVTGDEAGCYAEVVCPIAGVIGSAEHGFVNIAQDYLRSRNNLTQAIEGAWKDAKLPGEKLGSASCVLAVAGSANEKARDRLEVDLPFAALLFSDLPSCIVKGALGDNDGTVLHVDSRFFAGGQFDGTINSISHPLFCRGGEGSGEWLGTALLRQILRCGDGIMEHTDLTRRILARFDTMEEIETFSRKAKPAELTTLAQETILAGRQKDPIAVGLITELIAYLESCVSVLHSQSKAAICLSGSLASLLEGFLPHYIQKVLTRPKGDQKDGCRALAYDLSQSKVLTAHGNSGGLIQTDRNRISAIPQLPEHL